VHVVAVIVFLKRLKSINRLFPGKKCWREPQSTHNSATKYNDERLFGPKSSL
jgi:hypothetical protein